MVIIFKGWGFLNFAVICLSLIVVPTNVFDKCSDLLRFFTSEVITSTWNLIARLAWISVHRPWSHVLHSHAFWDEHTISCQQEERASETLGNITYPLSLVRGVLRSLKAKLWWRLRNPNLPFTSQLHASSIARDPTIRHCHRLKTANPPSHEPNTYKSVRYNGSMSCSKGTGQTQALKWTLAVKSECDFFQQILVLELAGNYFYFINYSKTSWSNTR